MKTANQQRKLNCMVDMVKVGQRVNRYLATLVKQAPAIKVGVQENWLLDRASKVGA